LLPLRYCFSANSPYWTRIPGLHMKIFSQSSACEVGSAWSIVFPCWERDQLVQVLQQERGFLSPDQPVARTDVERAHRECGCQFTLKLLG
jgi:hypothetical protein